MSSSYNNMFKKDGEASPEIPAGKAKKLTQMQLSTKHMKVRANPDEARKLNRISKELTKNPRLIEVETGGDHFERETN